MHWRVAFIFSLNFQVEYAMYNKYTSEHAVDLIVNSIRVWTSSICAVIIDAVTHVITK